MATTAPTELPGCRKYTEEGGTHEALPISIVTEFWLATVHTFDALYDVVFTSVYSRHGKAKMTPPEAKPCVTKFLDILSKNQDKTPPELLEYLKKSGIPSQGERGEQ